MNNVGASDNGPGVSIDEDTRTPLAAALDQNQTSVHSFWNCLMLRVIINASVFKGSCRTMITIIIVMISGISIVE